MTRVLIRDLEPGRQYFVQARVTGDQDSQWSQLFDLETTSDVMPPAPPTSLTWVVEGTAFKAVWVGPSTNQDGSPLSDFKDFQVNLYSPAAPSAIATYYTTAARFDFPFESNFNAFGTPRAQVTIEVRARDNTGNLSTAVSLTATNAAPSNITGLSVVGISDAVALRWDAVTDDDLKYYQVYEGTSSGSETNLVYTGLATSFIYDTVLTVPQYFKVYAVDVFNTNSAVAASGNATPRSTLSVDTTPPATPTGVGVTTTLDASDPSGSRSYIDVSWTAVADTDLQNYSVRYSTSSSGPWQYINVPEGIVTARINNLRPSTAYYVAVAAVDFAGNSSPYANASTFPITTSADTTAPSTPAIPTVAANALQIQVSHNGTKSGGGAMEADVDRYEVYASTTSGFTAGPSNMIGSIKNGVTIIGTFPIPVAASSGTTQNWYARVIAVDNAGNKSPASFQSTTSVPLIGATNIADATITNAKISDLAADKITAGSGIINNLLIKSALTIDTAGVIQSGNFNDTTKVGYQLANTTLKLYDGTVYARALVLKNGENLMPVQYADFEWAPAWYVTNPFATSHDGGTEVVSIATAATTTAKYTAQCLSIVRTASAGTYSRAILSTNATNYNINLEANTDYIVSGWFKTPNASGNKTIAMDLTSSAGTVTGTSQTVTADGNWARFSWVLTTNAQTTFNVAIKLLSAGTLYADGIQIEQKRTAETTPSQWRPPATTTLDGSGITTGSISSTASANGLSGQPAWSINTQGNAQFGDAAIRGRLVVGDITNPSADGTNSRVVSANYSAGSAGWIIRQDGYAEFNNVLVRGTFQGSNLFLNSSGTFFYSGTPAANNMTMAITPASGTDSFGNTYAAGQTIKNSGSISVYDSSNNLVTTIGGSDGTVTQLAGAFTVSLQGGKLTWRSIGTPGNSSYVGSASGNDNVLIHSGYPGGGGANLATELLVSTGDSTLGQDFQPIATVKESTGTHPAYVYVTGAIVKTSDWTGSNGTSWQTPTMSSGWATGPGVSGSYPPLKYRLDAEDNVHIHGTFHATSTTPGGVIASGLPNVGMGTLGGVGMAGFASKIIANGTPGMTMYLNNTGQLRAAFVPSTVAVNDTFSISAVVPLGGLI